MKNAIRNFVRNTLRIIHGIILHKYYKNVVRNNELMPFKGSKKKEWIKKWSVFGMKVDVIYYDVFSHYIGENINIVPENICHEVIERILNPVRYDGYYSDKNNFDKIFPKGFLPTTILRKMNGFYLGEDYKMININNASLQDLLEQSGYEKIVIKPTLDSCSGHGVKMAVRKTDRWHIIGEESILTCEYLQKNYGNDFIIQEAMKQSDYLSQFNPTSVNTLRITVYRSVINNKCVIPSAIMRIGGEGSILDNAHAGGGYTALKLDGTLGECVLDQYGKSVTKFNNIDFTTPHIIPNFDKVVSFAMQVGECVLNHRLLALDIMIDEKGEPRLIEFNTGTSSAYGIWLFQYTWTPAFGEYTDEILNYCKEHLNEAQMQIYI